MHELNIKFKKLHPDAQCPTKKNFDDAGWDLYAIENWTVIPNAVNNIRTGLSIAIPQGYVGLIWDRSGLAYHHGIHRIGGVIDAGYRGEIVVMLTAEDFYQNDMIPWPRIKAGDRVAQLIIQEIPLHISWEEAEELDVSNRGTDGFGSSGR